MQDTIAYLANKLDYAARRGKAIKQISRKHKLNLDDAYAIQAGIMDLHYARGEEFIGVKMGFTSKAKMEQMNVHDMIWGRLTNKHYIENGGEVKFKKFIHPRAEPEIAFKLKEDLEWPIEFEEPEEYIESMAPAIEIVDSRYKQFKFNLQDVVADNCSAAGFVLGNWVPFHPEITNLKMDLLFDGEVIQSSTSASILGNPVESVIAAARLSHKYEQELPAGSIILAGAATVAEYMEEGMSVETRVEGMGSATFNIN